MLENIPTAISQTKCKEKKNEKTKQNMQACGTIPSALRLCDFDTWLSGSLIALPHGVFIGKGRRETTQSQSQAGRDGRHSENYAMNPQNHYRFEKRANVNSIMFKNGRYGLNKQIWILESDLGFDLGSAPWSCLTLGKLLAFEILFPFFIKWLL